MSPKPAILLCYNMIPEDYVLYLLPIDQLDADLLTHIRACNGYYVNAHDMTEHMEVLSSVISGTNGDPSPLEKWKVNQERGVPVSLNAVDHGYFVTEVVVTGFLP